MASHRVGFTYLSQEDLLDAGCFDLRMAIEVAEKAMLAYEDQRIMYPEKLCRFLTRSVRIVLTVCLLPY